MKRILGILLTATMLITSVFGGALAQGTVEPTTIQFWNSFTGADGAQLVHLWTGSTQRTNGALL